MSEIILQHKPGKKVLLSRLHVLQVCTPPTLTFAAKSGLCWPVAIAVANYRNTAPCKDPAGQTVRPCSILIQHHSSPTIHC